MYIKGVKENTLNPNRRQSMKIINKATGEEFDYDEPITFEEAITDILTECDRINKVYPEEHCVINKNDLVLAS